MERAGTIEGSGINVLFEGCSLAVRGKPNTSSTTWKQ
jgi:hypothetical protein